MIEPLVVTFREGVEAALIVGITLAYLHRTGRGVLRKYAYLGLILGVAGSLLGAVALNALTGGEESELFEGATMLLGAAFVASLMVWMHRKRKELKADLEGRVENIAGSAGLAAGLGLLAFVSFMVLREGIETVIFLYSISASRASSLDFLGGSLGILLAVVVGVLVMKGSARIHLGKFFTVTSLMLAILVGQLVLKGIHEWMEIGLLPPNRALMGVAGPVANYGEVGLAAFLLVPAVAILVDMLWRDLPGPAAHEKPAERRKARFMAQRRATLKVLLGASVYGAAMLASSSLALAGRVAEEAAPPKAAPSGGKLKFEKGGLMDGDLHKFAYSADGVDIKFFLIRRADGTLVSAFDACQICGPKGYRKEGGDVICRNCGAPINIDSIGMGGGCNPLPLAHADDGTYVAVETEDLLAQKGRFL